MQPAPVFDLTAQDYFGHNEEMQEDIHEDRQTERKKLDSVRMIHTGTIWVDLRYLIPKDTSSLCNVASLHPHAICLSLSYVQGGAGCSHDLATGSIQVFSGSPAM